jgi:hypothetical protein
MAELIRSRPNERRAAHYLAQARKLREMDQAEPPANSANCSRSRRSMRLAANLSRETGSI